MTRRQSVAFGLKLGLMLSLPHWALASDEETGLGEPQPYFASVLRAIERLSSLGAPISASETEVLRGLASKGDVVSAEAAERILAPYTLARLSIGPGDASAVALGGAERRLTEQGWRLFLVWVANRTGATENIAF